MRDKLHPTVKSCNVQTKYLLIGGEDKEMVLKSLKYEKVRGCKAGILLSSEAYRTVAIQVIHFNYLT